MRNRRWLIVLALTVAACSPTRGCVESDFELAPESRLPKWFASTSTHIDRSKLRVTMADWGGPMGRTATFTLFDANGVNIDAVTATVQGDQPQTLESHGATERSPYPIYEVVVAKGITEIIEHRRMEPIFYITDDPDIKRRLGVRP